MVMFALIGSITVLAVVVSSSAEIVLFKCCTEANESYDVGNNKCIEDEQILQKRWPPSVYSLEGKRKVPWKINNFNITNNLINCEGDTVVQSSSDVTLFEDGTLKARKLSSKLDPGTFCIERAVKSKGNFAARFCLPDACKTKMCVRKCCPVGYSFEEQSCEPSGKEFSLKFQNETGYTVDLPATSLEIRSALLPNCPDGFLLLDPSTYPEDEFFLLPSGQLFVPSYKTDPVVDEYCVEDILVANNVICILWATIALIDSLTFRKVETKNTNGKH
jgi:Methuselah N-terminus